MRNMVAEAYFGACRKMVTALEALKAFDRAVASSTLDPVKSPSGQNCSKRRVNGFTLSSSNVKPCSFPVLRDSSKITRSRLRCGRA